MFSYSPHVVTLLFAIVCLAGCSTGPSAPANEVLIEVQGISQIHEMTELSQKLAPFRDTQSGPNAKARVKYTGEGPGWIELGPVSDFEGFVSKLKSLQMAKVLETVPSRRLIRVQLAR
jgi:hypothetical protein